MSNNLGLTGIEFIEFSAAESDRLDELFKAFGFSKKMTLKTKDCCYYNQNDIHFILSSRAKGHSKSFLAAHGPSIASMGWRFIDAKEAWKKALASGAVDATSVSEFSTKDGVIPAIYGIGDSLIYFIEDRLRKSIYSSMGFEHLLNNELVENKGFVSIDHLTNNVESGQLEKWSNFYKTIFGFKEVRYFDIKGAKTGLISHALQSPCGSFCIPINEGTEAKSQINEYLDQYKGPGIQHIAFLTNNILDSLEKLKDTNIKTLVIDDEYYQEVFSRVPNVVEDHAKLKEYQILIDGDEKGYLLQIFTKNIIGPIFVEIIQRKNHRSFGEGNFGALFRSIEKDQESRGYLS